MAVLGETSAIETFRGWFTAPTANADVLARKAGLATSELVAIFLSISNSDNKKESSSDKSCDENESLHFLLFYFFNIMIRNGEHERTHTSFRLHRFVILFKTKSRREKNAAKEKHDFGCPTATFC